jgi:hypothetical protein
MAFVASFLTYVNTSDVLCSTVCGKVYSYAAIIFAAMVLEEQHNVYFCIRFWALYHIGGHPYSMNG